MLEIVYTNQFKRDYRRAVRRNEDVEELFLVIDLLAKGQPLPQEKGTTHFLENIQDTESAM